VIFALTASFLVASPTDVAVTLHDLTAPDDAVDLALIFSARRCSPAGASVRVE